VASQTQTWINAAVTDDTGQLRAELEETRSLLVEAEAEARLAREELLRLQQSAAGRTAVRLQNTARRVAPLHTRRQRALHQVAQAAASLVEGGPAEVWHRVRRTRTLPDVGPSPFSDTPDGRRRQYRAWLAQHEPSAAQLEAMRAQSSSWTWQPLVSVLMPVHDPERRWLEAAIDSVRSQTYERWELCIADDASQQPHVADVLQRAADADSRIVITRRTTSGGIALATNAALERASGELIAFLDHDDALRPHALHRIVEHFAANREVLVVHSDEDKILPDGSHADPFFKPDFSPHMLLEWNYVTHFVTVRAELLRSLGGIREGFEGSQDHDMLLRAADGGTPFGHVADVLYGWRMIEGSAALSSDYKPLAREAGRRAVAEAVARRGDEATVDFGAQPGLYRVRYRITGTPRVAIIIPTRDQLAQLRACVGSLERLTTYSNYTITIVDNGSRRADTLAYLRASKHRVVTADIPFNHSVLINRGAEGLECDHLLLMNNDMSVITPEWLEAMLAHSQRADVGAVGARLLFRDGRVQHEGVVVGGLHLAGNVETGWPVAREVSAVTGACLMTRREVFESLGGLDESLAEAFNDVDYCLRTRAAGLRVLVTPLAELHHREGGTRGRRIPQHDADHFAARWGSAATLQDPYLNRNVLWPNPLRLRFD
jgi:GT2 family glycosyltransferase